MKKSNARANCGLKCYKRCEDVRLPLPRHCQFHVKYGTFFIFKSRYLIKRLQNKAAVCIFTNYYSNCRSQWPCGLRRRSATARLLRLWVRISPGAWMFVCCECCGLSGRGLCDELITRPEESYRLWCVVVCDLETSRMRRP